MAGLSNGGKYPPRLHRVGRAPIQDRSMNHYCFLGNLAMVREDVGQDVWDSLKQSALGVIIRLQESDYIWAAQTVHYFLTNQLAIKRKNEFWSLIANQPVRLSLHEFQDITGMNCDPLPKENIDVDHTVFWRDYLELKTPKGTVLNHGPKWSELKVVLSKCRSWEPKERKMLARLFILSVGVYGISPGSRIPFDAAKRVIDPKTFDEYPWGRVAFSSIIDSMKTETMK